MSASPTEPTAAAPDARVAYQTAAADACALLALLLQTPRPDDVEAMKGEALADDARAIAEELGATDAQADEITACFAEASLAIAAAGDDAHGLVRREHTRLFTHPKAPVIWPYEGIFVDTEVVRAGGVSSEPRLFVNREASDAEQAYREAGFECESRTRIPADTVTTELQFMGALHARAAESALEGDAEAYDRAIGRLDAFEKAHADQWLPQFFARCTEEGEGVFKAAGLLGQVYMQAEGARTAQKEEGAQ